MRIAVSGKGGSGKTTITSLLAETLVQKGHRLITIDADSNPNLALSLGVSPEDARTIPTISDLHINYAFDMLNLPVFIEKYSTKTPSGVPLLVMGSVNHADLGCLCQQYTAVRDLLGLFGRQNVLVTITDMTAGLEYMKRGTVRFIDAIFIVAEPYYRSLEVAARIKLLAEQLYIKHIYGVANKIRGNEDVQAVKEFFNECHLDLIACFPFDDKLIGSEVWAGSQGETEHEAIEKVVSQVESDYRKRLLCDIVFSFSEEFLLTAKPELSQREILTIRHLGQKGPMKMSQLSECNKAAFSTTTSIVDKLSEKKYVERFHDEADRRIVIVQLTESGENLYRDHMVAYENRVKEMMRSLTETEKTMLTKLMQIIVL